MHNAQYLETCFPFQFMPGQTTYLDTPALPLSAQAGGTTAYPVDCDYLDGTPRIREVITAAGGPWVAAADGTHTVSLVSEGFANVPNPAFQGVGGAEPSLVARDHGFGAAPGTVTINGIPLTVVAWDPNNLEVSVPAGVSTGQLVVTRADTGRSTVDGITLHVGGPVPVQVPNDFATIQEAIDAASPGDLVLVGPGIYNELVIMWKPIRLQGSGAGSTTIDANPATPANKITDWRTKAQSLVDSGDVFLLPGQGQQMGAGAPLFVTEEGPGILVMGNGLDPAWGGFGTVGGESNSLIDGLQIKGGATGGAVFVNGYADNLVISNNLMQTNGGLIAATGYCSTKVSLTCPTRRAAEYT